MRPDSLCEGLRGRGNNSAESLNGWSRARLTREPLPLWTDDAVRKVNNPMLTAVHTGHAAEMPAMLSK